MKRLVLLVVAAFMVAGLAAPTQAAIITFGTAAFSGADGLQTFGPIVVDGVPMTLSAHPALLNASLLWTFGAGFGVVNDLNDNDEVDTVDIFRIDFVSPVTLQGIQITDLFNEGFFGYNERGWYAINNGPQIDFESIGDPDGDLAIDLAVSGVTSIAFGAPLFDFRHDYTVSAIDVQASVPEPGSMLLLGCGLIGAAWAVRRRTKK